ncbi:MAG TPA: hypothetical protein VFI06_08840 [Chitinophagaceae bacterium]|nr:hypothetical protein [Chitinophagaceae bacterium]
MAILSILSAPGWVIFSHSGLGHSHFSSVILVSRHDATTQRLYYEGTRCAFAPWREIFLAIIASWSKGKRSMIKPVANTIIRNWILLLLNSNAAVSITRVTNVTAKRPGIRQRSGQKKKEIKRRSFAGSAGPN